MEKKRLTINIAGQEFRIYSENDGEYIKELAAAVNKRVREVQAQYPSQSTSRCALLAMLSMEEELESLRAENAEVDRKISELRNIRESSQNREQAPVKRPFERKKPVGV